MLWIIELCNIFSFLGANREIRSMHEIFFPKIWQPSILEIKLNSIQFNFGFCLRKLSNCPNVASPRRTRAKIFFFFETAGSRATWKWFDLGSISMDSRLFFTPWKSFIFPFKVVCFLNVIAFGWKDVKKQVQANKNR